jgi:K+/H+ antiporter YhaU regulatory subunit KhtT
MNPAPRIHSSTLAGVALKEEKGGNVKAEKMGKTASETGRFVVTLFLSEETHKQLKQHSLDERTSMQRILEEALDDYFAKKSLSPLVKAPSKGSK